MGGFETLLLQNIAKQSCSLARVSLTWHPVEPQHVIKQRLTLLGGANMSIFLTYQVRLIHHLMRFSGRVLRVILAIHYITDARDTNEITQCSLHQEKLLYRI